MNNPMMFFVLCGDHPHGDELLRIFEKRMNEGVLPEWDYLTNKYDYTNKMGDLANFLSEFDKLYYPKKLISDEVFLKINPIIDNFNKLTEIVLSLNSNNFASPDVAFIFLNEAGKTFYQLDIDINRILYETKKDLFVYILHKQIKTLSIEAIYTMLEEDNKNNCLYFELPSLDKEKNIINSTIWKVYSYEMRFYDNFLEMKNKYRVLFQSKFEELQRELEKKFTVIEKIELDDGTVDEININLLSEMYEILKIKKN